MLSSLNRQSAPNVTPSAIKGAELETENHFFLGGRRRAEDIVIVDEVCNWGQYDREYHQLHTRDEAIPRNHIALVLQHKGTTNNGGETRLTIEIS